jgi:hypothetical protein
MIFFPCVHLLVSDTSTISLIHTCTNIQHNIQRFTIINVVLIIIVCAGLYLILFIIFKIIYRIIIYL